jgi:hypothetical protein
MKIDVATSNEIFDVALRMRERDFDEISALAAADTRKELARSLMVRYGGRKDVWCAAGAHGPTAVGGAIEVRPNVITLLFFATDDFPEIGLALTKFIVKRLFPPLVAAGVHRIECVSLDGYDEVHRWIQTLGLFREFDRPMVKYGKRGESFVQFAWAAGGAS